ncbi:MAG TPA: adenosylcobinamide-GDP ribazoletransferase [Stellaceae bacterium]|nr:adenosylcobinamide-GDP ribazoletransferase [Stellaceae bacterium]
MRLSFWSDGERRRTELLIAARFLTRLPFGAATAPEPGDLARASWALPLVGAAIGVACAAIFAVAMSVHMPPLCAALLAVGTGTLVTGALHEDGLADTADGLGGGADREAKLAIMRDSRSGAYGVLAVVFSVGLRAAAVATLASGGAALAAFVAAHAVGRGGLPAVLYLVPAARSDGLGAAAGRPEAEEMAWALGLAAVIALAALGLGAGIAALVIAGLTMAALAALAERQIGGHTGDVLGAIEQGGETAMLLAAASWAW